jgi:hypothetical protein
MFESICSEAALRHVGLHPDIVLLLGGESPSTCRLI